MPKHVKLVAVYPAYVVVRGPSQDVSVPAISFQPYLPNGLFPHGSGIEKGLGRLVDVPQLRQDKSCGSEDVPQLRQKRAPHSSLEEGSSPASSLVGVFSPIRVVPEEKSGQA